MERRIQEFDVLRVLAMLFVITYHFWYEYATDGLPHVNLFYVTPNYDFGNVAVTIFLILSGSVLYKKYGAADTFEKIPLKTFYLKRIKTIYPPFWLLSLYIPFTMVRHLINDGNLFFLGNPLKLLLTVIGFDGYFRGLGFETYAFCGDWFVGAIVFLYVLFPLLAKWYRKNPVLMLIQLAILYGAQYLIPAEYDSVFSILPVTISFKFCLGFYLVEKLEYLRNVRVALSAGLVFALLSFFNIPGRINTDCLGAIAAIALFAVVFSVSPWVLRYNVAVASIQKLATLSYCVFLVQHVAIVWTKRFFVAFFERMQWQFSCWTSVFFLALTFAVILAVSWILKLVTDRIVCCFAK